MDDSDFKIEAFRRDELVKILAEADQAKSNYRPRLDREVNRIRDAMVAGKWEPNNGTVLRFNDKGLLIDGQHRVAAAIKAYDADPNFVFITGTLRNCVDVEIDTGVIRSFSNKLRAESYKFTSVLGPAIEVFILLYREKMNVQAPRANSHSVKLSVLSKVPELNSAVERVRLARASVGNGSVLSAMYVAMSAVDSKKANYFIDVLAEPGLSKSQDCPVYALYKAMNADAKSPRKVAPFVKRMWAVKAWNAYALGKTMKVLRYTKGEDIRFYGINKFLSFCKDRGLDHDLGHVYDDDDTGTNQTAIQILEACANGAITSKSHAREVLRAGKRVSSAWDELINSGRLVEFDGRFVPA